MPDRPRPNMAFGEILSFSYDTFCSNKVRFILTALGMVIGTASLILVVTIGMTGKQYALGQIQAIGTNEIWAEYEGAQHISNSSLDPLTVEDVQAVQEQVPGVDCGFACRHSGRAYPNRKRRREGRANSRGLSRVPARAQPDRSFRTLLRS